MIQTEKRYVSNFKDGKWDGGVLTEDANIVLNECAGVLQYAQTVFEGMKAYTTEDGHIVAFRPDLNAERMADSARRLEMPAFPEDRFVDAVEQSSKGKCSLCTAVWIRRNSCTSVRICSVSNPVIGVKPADEYQFRVFTDTGRSVLQGRRKTDYNPCQ